MVYKKIIAVLLVLCLLAFAGCTAKNPSQSGANTSTSSSVDSEASNSEVIKSFVRSIYEVKDHEMYKRLDKSIKTAISTGTGETGAVFYENSEEAYKEYKEKLKPYTTEKGLNSIFVNPDATFMDALAYDSDMLTEVTDINVINTDAGSQNMQYNYTVKLNFIRDGKSIAATGSGIIELAKDTDGTYKVDFLRRTDSKAIDTAVTALQK